MPSQRTPEWINVYDPTDPVGASLQAYDVSRTEPGVPAPVNYGYCVFGVVSEGLEVADKISQSPTTNQGGDLSQTPNPPVVIKSVRVVR